MTYTFLFVMIVLVVLFSGAPGQQDGNFPLQDCDTGQLDILLVKSNSFDNGLTQPPNSYLDDYTDIWTPNEMTSSRVRINRAYAIYQDNTYSCNVEIVRHGNGFSDIMDICSLMEITTSRTLTTGSVQADIELKIKIATSIWSDLSDDRRNSTKVAILTVDSSIYPTLTADEIIRIPDILEKKNLTIKVFIMVYNTQSDQIFLKDTIITDRYISARTASMVICNRCMPDWFSLKLTETDDFMSCYYLDISPIAVDWYEATSTCAFKGGNLATIESQEELAGLQEQVFRRLLASRENGDISEGNSTAIYLGLKRDITTVAKQFQWEHPSGFRPIVINNWLPGNPNGIFTHSCGTWVYNGIDNYTTPDQELENTSANRSIFADYKSRNSEGWTSVRCGMQLSRFSLCELTLSRSVRDKQERRLQQTNIDNVIEALNISEFQEFEGKIVSVSANVNNEEFLRFLKNKNEEFPLFDCGDDGTQPRYISYSYVCDYTDHCKSGQDEIECYPSYSTPRCQSGKMISHFDDLCDMIKDCPDGSDENYCPDCAGRRCCDGTCLPSHLFNDGEIDCNDCKTSDDVMVVNKPRHPNKVVFIHEKCAFICNRFTCIYPSQLGDGKWDCIGPEGPLDETLGRLEKADSCPDKLGRYVWAPRCVYLRDRYGSVLGCEDLSHLQNCSDFPCQEGYHKCPRRYCIPLHYVMDGINDCPAGEEEEYLLNHTCIGNFACWNSKVCLHPDLVCDRAVQCPYNDDELNCDMSCPRGFRCIAGTIVVEENALIQSDVLNFKYYTARYIDMSGVNLSRFSGNIDIYTLLNYHVRLSRCAIKDVNEGFAFKKYFLKNVQKIDLSYNLIKSFNEDRIGMLNNLQLLNLSFNTNLEHVSIQSLKRLDIVDFSHTGLSILSETSFVDLPNLKHLNLSHTRISAFHRHIFPSSFTLQTLDLRGSPIVKFFENTYNGLRVTSALYTDNFGLCCPQVRGTSIPEYMCHASGDAVSSCFDLIGADIQKIILWLMAGISLLGNLVVILYRLVWDRRVLEKTYGLFVLNLGISDAIMGIYLLMIAASDVYYRGVYVLYDKEWKESVVCKMAGFLATLSRETSSFFIFLITVDRFLVLRFPYGQRKFSKMTKIVAIGLAWGIGFVFALISVMPIFGHESVFTYSAMCIGLPLTDSQVNGWEYSVSVFIVLNFIMFLLTALGQALIFKSVSENRMPVDSTNQNSLRRAQDITVAKQLSLVVMSDFICWFPVGLMGFLSLSGHEISNEVFAWTVVLVLPVNSAINPVLYTIPVLMAKWKNFKYGKSNSH